MAKITNVMIKDHNTLILNQDAQVGDEIDLLSLNSVDTSILVKRVKEGKDQEYNNLLEKAKINLRKEIETEYKMILKDHEIDYNKKVVELEAELKKVKENSLNEVKLAVGNAEKSYLDQINELKEQLNLFEAKKDLELHKKIKEYEDKINQISSDTQIQIANLKSEYEGKLNDQELANAQLKIDHTKALQEKDSQINKLTLSKSSLSIKKLGESLESWCNNEYLDYAQNGFDNCTWIKDNLSVRDEGEKKGTKADYIFRVYATSDLNPEEELSSVCCEMKNEDPESTHKKKNSDHYAKLEADRIKKNCKYALLISELEWDQDNDVPIRKVPSYPNMYVVRPQYFMTFLSIISSLSLKFKDLYLKKEREMLLFKDTEDILREFEELKLNLLDKPLKLMESEVEKINDSVVKIKNQADKISESATKIAASHIVSIRSKIESYTIKKTIKKINSLN